MLTPWTRRGLLASLAGAAALPAWSAGSDAGQPPHVAPGRGGDDPPSPAGRAFDTAELIEGQVMQRRPYADFLDEPTMRMGLYILPAGGRDRQSPHQLDEAYYVIEGRSKLTVEGETMDVEAGRVLFVRAGAEHRFHDIEETLKLLVFFSTAKAGD